MKRYSGLSFAGVLLVCLVMTWSTVQAQGHFESISFENHGAMLQGRWYPAPSRPAPTVILLHGFPGGKGDVLGFGEVFQKAGWNALSFNYRGVWDSGGTYTLANSLADVSAAIRFIQSRNIKDEIDLSLALLGYSFGGWVTLLEGADNDSLNCLISVAPANFGEFARLIVNDPEFRKWIEQHIKNTMTGSPANGLGVQAAITEILLNVDTYDPINHASDLAQKPLLIIGGWRDMQSSIEGHVLPIIRSIQKDKTENLTPVLLDDNHSFQDTRSELHSVVLNWINEACLKTK